MKLAYTYVEAAEACGVGETRIKEAVRNGELVARYPSSRPVITRDELDEWLRSLPTERRTA